MYEELIAKMNPCPKLNLQWYKNEDLYSDGEVEDFIIKIIAENRPEDYSNAVYEQFNWPIYYHLSPLRKNILNWYKFKPDSSVLEIGCGMGALQVYCAMNVRMLRQWNSQENVQQQRFSGAVKKKILRLLLET